MRRKTQELNSDSSLRDRFQRGFTFMELLIVMVIIAIMVTVAIPKVVVYFKRAKEVTLQQNLWAMRNAISSYSADKDRPPANLQEVVSAGYLREMPKDPVCDECQWIEVPAPADDVSSAGGIGDVKSSAPGEDTNGKPYADY
jgi:general secretion pathway protein G